MPHEPSPSLRTGVLLAAGAGSRMPASIPKPLVRVHGLRLIERGLLALHAVGVTRFIVVVGARGEEVTATLRRSRRVAHLPIEIVPCPTWERGNGHSLACGAAAAGEAFYLAMADHVFDPGIVERLRDAAARHPDDVHLATDARLADVFDLGDATKVRVADDRVVDLGKGLDEFDRVDVGVFACPAAMASEAADAVASGATSVSEVMQRFIARRAMRAVAVDGLPWQDVDTEAMRIEAERMLLEATRKPTDGPVSRLLNRPVSLRISRVLAPWDVSPNLVTTIVFAMGIVAAAAIVWGTWPALLAAAVLTHVASVIDGCDGELARVNLRGTAFGAWYDTITDNIRYALLVVASALSAYRRHDELGYLLGGAVFAVFAVYLVAVMTAYLRRTGAAGTHLVVVRRVEEQAARLGRTPLMRLLLRSRSLAKQDVLAFLAAVVLAVGLPEVILVGGLIAVVAMIVVVDRALERRRAMGFMMAVAGIVLLGAIVAQAPLQDIARSLRAVGPGVLLAIPIVLAWMLANTMGMHGLLARRVGLVPLLLNRIVGDGYNAIVPAAGIGGEPVRIALLGDHVSKVEATIAVVTDRAINIASGLLASSLALGASLAWLPPARKYATAIGSYAALAGIGAGVIVAVVLRRGGGRLDAFLARVTGSPLPSERRIRKAAIVTALAWNLVGRALAVLEVVLYAAMLGLPLSIVELLFVTGILHGVGTVAFVVPQGLGVAEVASVFAIGVLGYPPAVGISFGLLRRCRILVFSAVAVVAHLWRGLGARSNGDTIASAPKASGSRSRS